MQSDNSARHTDPACQKKVVLAQGAAETEQQTGWRRFVKCQLMWKLVSFILVPEVPQPIMDAKDALSGNEFL